MVGRYAVIGVGEVDLQLGCAKISILAKVWPTSEPQRHVWLSLIPRRSSAKVGSGKTSLTRPKKQVLFSQGDAADAVFYIQRGQVKITVVSQQGKEAIIAILEPGGFFGEGCLAGQLACMATATAIGNSDLVRIDKQAMIKVLHNEPAFSELFLALSPAHATFASKRIWLINSLTPVRNGWRGYCS